MPTNSSTCNPNTKVFRRLLSLLPSLCLAIVFLNGNIAWFLKTVNHDIVPQTSSPSSSSLNYDLPSIQEGTDDWRTLLVQQRERDATTTTTAKIATTTSRDDSLSLFPYRRRDKVTILSATEMLFHLNFPPIALDRIYYVNLDKNTERRAMMDNWLTLAAVQRHSPPIPFERIPAQIGRAGVCEAGAKNESASWCRGLSGCAKTTTGILETPNVTTGTTLILQDDFVIYDMELLRKSVHFVPDDDWDVIRWNCWGHVPSTLPRLNPFVFRTMHESRCTATTTSTTTKTKDDTPPPCWFCGGAHAMLIRDKSVPRLHRLWSKQPYNSIDCRLLTPDVKSYCININFSPTTRHSDLGYFMKPKNETTDIPTKDAMSSKSQQRQRATTTNKTTTTTNNKTTTTTISSIKVNHRPVEDKTTHKAVTHTNFAQVNRSIRHRNVAARVVDRPIDQNSTVATPPVDSS